MEQEPTIWENIFANDTSDEVSPKYIKNLQDSTPEKNQSNSEMGKGPKQTLLQGGHTEGPETYEKMLSINNHQRDTN